MSPRIKHVVFNVALKTRSLKQTRKPQLSQKRLSLVSLCWSKFSNSISFFWPALICKLPKLDAAVEKTSKELEQKRAITNITAWKKFLKSSFKVVKKIQLKVSKVLLYVWGNELQLKCGLFSSYFLYLYKHSKTFSHKNKISQQIVYMIIKNTITGGFTKDIEI